MNDFTHGGHIRQLSEAAGCARGEILDFSANINPLGLPDWLRGLVGSELSGLTHYPDPHCGELLQAAAQRFGVPTDEIVAGNGSTEILYALCPALGIRRAIVPVPCYTDYRRACELSGVEVRALVLDEAVGFSVDFKALGRMLEQDGAEDCAVFLGQPNNPTGVCFDPAALRALAERFPQAWFVVDEAFADFVPGLDRLASSRPANVIVLYSLTKFYAVPGLRLGLGFASGVAASAIARRIPPWSVNGLAQAVGCRALEDEDYGQRTRLAVAELRTDLAAGLSGLPGLTVFPGSANFLFCRLDRHGLDAPALAERLLRQRLAIRVCQTFEGLNGRFFRVAVRPAWENALLIQALEQTLGTGTDSPRSCAVHLRPRRTPAIMVQGCSSNAGKSVLAAALCRILLQDGYAVAPFKSQNMSLNSFVTRDGHEMGRAQVTQAQACRLDPDVRMNPVLLKPSSDTGSQVIVMGRPVGNMKVKEYVRYKPEAFAKAKEAYDSLAGEFEVMVLEGAGSPAEVNLKRHDIVNMTMARHAGAGVLLAGDIDRGGVFASFVGTMELLSESERALVRGFVVNNFRGDASLLDEALTITTARTGVPFTGVVPHLIDLGLPEEDSVSFKSGILDRQPSSERVVEIAVLDLPHISNFTDLDALLGEPDVHLRVVRRASDLGQPQAVILPGSKNVVADMRFVRESGLAQAVLDLAARGETEIVGICGGFQMLGRMIRDPHGLESGGELPGLGLLPLETELAREKTLVRTRALHVLSGCALHGYEIHHGRTTPLGDSPELAVLREDGQALGYMDPTGLVWGSYLHGLFDADEFRRWFVDRLRQRCGHLPVGRVVAVYDLEAALDRLARTVRASLDMGAVYRAAGLR
ncbi:MAG: cobyric acid synthase [Proteobacteria bacterium]|nr:cobyric acid synthase [Pseudomonadota bacterium]